MYYNATRKVIPLSGDREIIIETGKLAKQADGSVVVKQGNTMLLATVTAAKEPKDDCDFMPLSVEYKAVSYTHLDVYKRQRLGRSGVRCRSAAVRRVRDGRKIGPDRPFPLVGSQCRVRCV